MQFIRKIIAHACCILFCFALAGCGPGGTGDVTTVQKAEHRIGADETVTLLRIKIESLNSSPWERVLILRNGTVAGLTPLMRMTGINCDGAQQCRIAALPPGSIWPQSYAINPERFFVSDYKITDMDNPGRNFSIPIDADNVLGRRPGLTLASDLANESALVRDFVMREFGHIMYIAPLAFGLAALAFAILASLGWTIRRIWPHSGFANGLRRWPFSRTVPMAGYIGATVMFVLQFTVTMMAGEYVGMGKYQLMFGPKADVLIGKSGLEPILVFLAMLAGIAAFHVIVRALAGFLTDNKASA